MAARLHLKIGVVAEQDRLSSSADSILVSEPATGSRARSKGSLYVVVTARSSGGRPREAAALVAETIRREYYYDESAGIPVVLDKAVRAANRRLRHQREGHGLAPGSVGASIAVIRVNELYVATIGDADAYLVRQARLLMPEHQPSGGLPAPDGMHIDVWRGEFAIGDSLILVARNLTDVVGTEEIKNAVVTLHPQSAVEHLHHLFVAGSGEGSDAVLAIEATEIAASRNEKRLVPVTPAEPLASAPSHGGRDPFNVAASAVSGAGRRVQGAVGSAFGGFVDRIFDVLPQRRAKFKKVRPLVARRNAQRRYAIALLMVLSFISVVGVGTYLAAGFQPKDQDIVQVNTAEQALVEAETKINRALGAGDVPIGEENQALKLLQEAWKALDLAKSKGAPDAQVTPLRTRAGNGLDILYRTRRPSATPIVRFATVLPGADPRDLVLGPTQDANAAYFIDRASKTVVRVDLASGRAAPIIKAGDGPGASGIGTPAHLGAGGPDVLIVDSRGELWRWRPSNDEGNGTLNPIRVGGEGPWGNDVIDIATFLVRPEDGLYNLYVIDPSAGQILRYTPTADGSGFSNPGNYLQGVEADVAKAFRGLLIDGDVYVLNAETIDRYANGRKSGSFALKPPPDQADLRPGQELALFAGTGPKDSGRLYAWDRKHERLLVYGKNGNYQEQFVPRGSVPPLKDVRGIAVQEGAEGEPPTLLWVTTTALYSSPLVDTGPSVSPSGSPRASGDASPSASPRGSGRTPSPSPDP